MVSQSASIYTVLGQLIPPSETSGLRGFFFVTKWLLSAFIGSHLPVLVSGLEQDRAGLLPFSKRELPLRPTVKFPLEPPCWELSTLFSFKGPSEGPWPPGLLWPREAPTCPCEAKSQVPRPGRGVLLGWRCRRCILAGRCCLLPASPPPAV